MKLLTLFCVSVPCLLFTIVSWFLEVRSPVLLAPQRYHKLLVMQKMCIMCTGNKIWQHLIAKFAAANAKEMLVSVMIVSSLNTLIVTYIYVTIITTDVSTAKSVACLTAVSHQVIAHMYSNVPSADVVDMLYEMLLLIHDTRCLSYCHLYVC